MSLIKLPTLGKKENIDYFLALILRNEKAKAVIFSKTGNTIKYLNQAEAPFTNTVEDATMEEFLNVLDKSITSAESVLPQNIETHKTLFGLKESWVEDNKIKKEYLDKLKKAGDELSLDPIGFLVFSEAVVNLLHKEEGAPVTAILAEVGEKYATVSLIKSGKIVEVRSSEIHESVSFTVDTILKHLQTPEVMPSRIILFDGGKKDLTQEFIGHQWSKSLPFLHLPQTLNLPKDSDIKAMLLGAATQMGANLVFDHKAQLADNFETVEKGTILTPEDSDQISTKPFENDESEKESLDYVGKDRSLEFFGFSTADIAKEKPPIVTEKIANIPNEVVSAQTEEIPSEIKMEEEKNDEVPSLGVMTTQRAKKFSASIGPMLTAFSSKIIPFLKVNGVKDRKLIIFGVGGLIILLLIFFLFVFQTKADVTIAVNPKVNSKTLSVTFSPNGSTNLESNVVAAQIIPVDESGATTVSTSGKKDIGNKAKGKVTIFNNDTDPVTLQAGTTISSANGLKFDLDSTVKVGSASGDVFSGTKPGTADVNITADDIGTDYNLPSGTKFTIGSNKNTAGKNDNAFSGGTKKNVTVVSKDDIAKLETNLPKELSNKAKSDIASKVKDGETVLSDFIDTTLDNEKFSKKVDDQSSDVSLSANVSFNYLSYSDSDMANLASKLFDDSSFNVEKSNLETSAKNIKIAKNKDIGADLTIKAKLFPKIDVGALTNQIAGMDNLKAKNMLGNLTNVTSVTVNIHPNIPFLSSSLPKNPNNIKINVTSN